MAYCYSSCGVCIGKLSRIGNRIAGSVYARFENKTHKDKKKYEKKSQLKASGMRCAASAMSIDWEI